jgi:hypothetical protein
MLTILKEETDGLCLVRRIEFIPRHFKYQREIILKKFDFTTVNL